MKNKFENLTHKIPYYAGAHGLFLLDDGTVFMGLKLQGLDTMSMTPEMLIGMKARIKNVFEILPTGFFVQILHDYTDVDAKSLKHLSEPIKSENPVAQAFSASYRHNLRENACVKNISLHVYIICPAGSDNLVQNLAGMVQKFSTWHVRKEKGREYDLYSRFKEKQVEMMNLTARLQYAFKNLLGLDSHVIDRQEFYHTAFKFLNPGLQPTPPKPALEGECHESKANQFLTLREELTHSVIEEHAEYLKIGEQFATVLTLKMPSQFTQESDAERILNTLGFPFTWSFNFKVIDTASMNHKLEARQKRKHAFVVSSDNPDTSSSVSKSEHEEALMDQKIKGFNWYEVSYSFLIYADSVEILKDRSMRLNSLFRDIQESVLLVEHSGQLNAFLATLPGLGYRNNRQFLFSSLNISDLAPLSEPPRGTKDYSCYLQTHRDTLFNSSTFSNEFNNWNQVVIGQIGSGKSFIVNNILTLALMNMDKPRVMILDLGQSFKRTTTLWGGEYMTIDLDHPDCGLNPLPPHDVILNNGETVLGLLEFTVQLILRMLEIETNTRLYARIIKRALVKTYAKCPHRDPILTDFYHTLLSPGEFVDDDDDKKMAKELAKLLEDYVEGGPYSRLFDRQSTLTHKSDFFCFDFKNADQNKHIREIATYIVGGYICRKMTENPYPKFIVFDEFSTTMKHETGAALCEMIAKNCRKHGASFITISQQVSDFLEHKSSQTLYNQANFKWFLKMNDNLLKEQETLKLNATDIDTISKLRMAKGEYAEVYLAYGDKKALLKLCPDPLTYWACTTDPSDKIILNAYVNYFSGRDVVICKGLMQGYDKTFSGFEAQFLAEQMQQNPLLTILKLLAAKYPKGVDEHILEVDLVYQQLLKGDEDRRVAVNG